MVVKRLVLLVLCLILSTCPVIGANVDIFYDGFELGSVHAGYWTELGGGLADVRSDGYANGGLEYLALQTSVATSYIQAMLATDFNLNYNGLKLSFYWGESTGGDETDYCPISWSGTNPMGDCVALTCDGNVWYNIYNLTEGVLGDYQNVILDLSSKADVLCGGLTDSSRIAFAEYDNYQFHTDGIMIDDVNLYYSDSESQVLNFTYISNGTVTDGFDSVGGVFETVSKIASGGITLNSTHTAGSFISQVFNASDIAIWDVLSFARNAEVKDEHEVGAQFGDDVDDLVMLLHLNEGSGTAQDSTANNYDGTLTGGATWTTSGKFDNAVQFAGSPQYVDLGTSVDDYLGSGFTIAMWVKPSAVGGTHTFISNQVLTFRITANAIQVYLYNSATNRVGRSGNHGMVAGNWYHIVATWNGSTALDGSGFKIYKNAVQVPTGTYSGSQFTGYSQSAETLKLGTAQWSQGWYQYGGVMDEVGIWNRALSANEVSNLYEAALNSIMFSARGCRQSDCSDASWTKQDYANPIDLNVDVSPYFQYKADLFRVNTSFQAILNNVTVNYTLVPYDYGLTYLVNDSEPVRYTYVAGSRENVSFDEVTNGLILDVGTDTGSFISDVFDMGIISEWYNVSWMANDPILSNHEITEECEDNFTGLQVLLHMNEGSGTAYDSSGNGNDGTLSNVVWDSGGKFDDCIDVGGSPSYIDLGTDIDDTLANGYTLSAWVKPDTVSGTRTIFSNQIVTLRLSGSAIQSYLYNGADNRIGQSGTHGLTAGNWYHIVTTWDGSTSLDGSGFKIYIDGVEKPSGSYGAGYFSGYSTSADPFRVGTAQWTQGWYNFDGLIDEVAIWNRTLSSAEVSNLYKALINKIGVSKRTCGDSKCAEHEGWDVTSTERSELLNLEDTRYFQYKADFGLCGRDGDIQFYNVTIKNNVSDLIPDTSLFDGSTTDFAHEGDFYVDYPIIHNSSYCLIQWDSKSVNIAGANFTEYLGCGSEWINLESSYLPEDVNSSANITLYGVYYDNIPAVYEDGELCTDCHILSYSAGIYEFNVSHFTNYSLGPNSKLEIWDDSDLDMMYATGFSVVGLKTMFYANYSNVTNSASITGAVCNISFNDSVSGAMSYNSTKGLYEYNRTFTSLGNYSWNVTCTKTGYEELNVTDDLRVTYCANPIDDLQVNVNMTLCPGIFQVNDSGLSGILRLETSNVVLTCNQTKIVGNTTGQGMYVLGENISIVGCNFSDYGTNININADGGTYKNLTLANSLGNSISASSDTHLTFKNIIIINSGNYGLSIYSTHNTLVDAIYVENSSSNGAIIYGGSYNNTVLNSRFFNNGGNGIVFTGGENNTLSGIETINNTAGRGIYFSGGYANKVYDSYSLNDKWGSIVNCDDALYENVTITNSTEYGLLISESNNGSFTQMTVEGSTNYGIGLSGSHNNTFSHTSIYNNDVGAILQLSLLNMNHSTGNSFYSNNFVNNSVQVTAQSPSNYWNTSINGITIGNFWDDIEDNQMEIFDSDLDGYGDTGNDYPYNSSNGGSINGFYASDVNDFAPIITDSDNDGDPDWHDCNDNDNSVFSPFINQEITSNTTFCQGEYDVGLSGSGTAITLKPGEWCSGTFVNATPVLAINGSAWSSESEGPKAIDGDVWSEWKSLGGSGEHWLWLDLGQLKCSRGVNVFIADGNFIGQSFTVEVSRDNSEWFNLGEYTSDSSGWNYLPFEKKKIRYFRINATEFANAEDKLGIGSINAEVQDLITGQGYAVSGNNTKLNGTTIGYSIYSANTENITIKNLDFYSAEYAIGIFNASGLKIINCDSVNPEEAGIYFSNVTESSIDATNVTGAFDGIYIASSDRINITGTNISYCQHSGIETNSASNILIANGDIRNVTFGSLAVGSGILLSETNFTQILNMTLTGNQGGITISNSINTTIQNADIGGFGEGFIPWGMKLCDVRIYGSNHTIVTGSTLTGAECGIYFNTDSYNNLAYQNNFTSNLFYNAYAEAEGNYLNTTLGVVSIGNLWDDIENNNLKIFDSNLDGYGDSGEEYPYNSSNNANISSHLIDYAPIIVDSDSDGDPDWRDCDDADSTKLSPYAGMHIYENTTICQGSYSLTPPDNVFNIHTGKRCGSSMVNVTPISAINGSMWSVDHNATNMIDSNVWTEWQSNTTGPHWIKLDIGSVRCLNAVSVYIADGNFIGQSLYISTSDDGNSWAYQGVFDNNLSGWNNYYFDLTKKARYVRLDLVHFSESETRLGVGEFRAEVADEVSGEHYTLDAYSVSMDGIDASANATSIINVENVTIKGLGLKNYDVGFYLENSSYITFEDINSSNQDSYGLYAENSRLLSITNFTEYGANTGIYVNYSGNAYNNFKDITSYAGTSSSSGLVVYNSSYSNYTNLVMYGRPTYFSGSNNRIVGVQVTDHNLPYSVNLIGNDNLLRNAYIRNGSTHPVIGAIPIDGDSNEIDNVTVEDSTNGINIAGNENVVSNSTFNGSDTAFIVYANGIGNIFADNIIESGSQVSLYGGSGNNFTNNRVYNLTRGIKTLSSNSKISGNTIDSITEGSGITVTAQNVTLSSNKILSCSVSGINISAPGSSLSGIILENINISASGNSGVILQNANNISLTNISSVSNTDHGIYIQNTNDSVILDSSVSSNTNDGVYLYQSDRVSIKGFNATGNDYALTVDDSDDLNISTLYSYNNNRGIFLSSGTLDIQDSLFWNNGYDFYTGTSGTYEFTNVTFTNPLGTLENYTVLDVQESFSGATTNHWINWTAEPAEPPTDFESFNHKYLQITGGVGASIDSITWRWQDSEVGVRNESRLKIWVYDAGWNVLSSILDEGLNTLTVTNVVPSSTYGIFENLTTTEEGCVIINSDVDGSSYSIDALYSTPCHIENSTVTNSNITSAVIINSNINNSLIKDSRVTNTSFNDSSILFSEVLYSTFCGAFDVFTAGIDGDEFATGRIRYNATDYYAPALLSQICAGYVPPYDSSAPGALKVYDGLSGEDIDWFNNNETLSAHWSEAEEDISTTYYKYLVMINETECLQGDCNFTSVGTDRNVTLTNLSLSEGNNFTFVLIAYNAYGKESQNATSDGVVLDMTPPNIPTVWSTTHPNESITYHKDDISLLWESADPLFGGVSSGIEGYSFLLDTNNIVFPDQILEARYKKTIAVNQNTGYSELLLENGTGGSAYSVFKEIKTNLTSGQKLYVDVTLAEITSETDEEIIFQIYAIDSDPVGYDMAGSAVSDIITLQEDIAYASNALIAHTYPVELTINSDVTDSLYVVVSAESSQDNTHNITVAGTEDNPDNTTRSWKCENGGTCIENTNTTDYAIKVRTESANSTYEKEYFNVADGNYWFHVIAKDRAGNFGNPEHFNISILTGTFDVEIMNPITGQVFSDSSINATIRTSTNASLNIQVEHPDGSVYRSPQYNINGTVIIPGILLEAGINKMYAVANSIGGEELRSENVYVTYAPQISVVDKTLVIKYSVAGSGTEVPHITYVKPGTYTLGLATEDRSASVVQSPMELTTDTSFHTAKIFMTLADADTSDAREKLQDDELVHQEIPLFGWERKVAEYQIATLLGYEDIQISGNADTSTGVYRIRLINYGLTEDGRKNVSISVE